MKMLEELPSDMRGRAKTPASSFLFLQVDKEQG